MYMAALYNLKRKQMLPISPFYPKNNLVAEFWLRKTYQPKDIKEALWDVNLDLPVPSPALTIALYWLSQISDQCTDDCKAKAYCLKYDVTVHEFNFV